MTQAQMDRQLKETTSVESTSSVVNALGDLTNTLKQIVSRLDKQESRLVSMEKNLESSSNSSSSPGSAKRSKVPLVVRVCLLFHNPTPFPSRSQF